MKTLIEKINKYGVKEYENAKHPNGTKIKKLVAELAEILTLENSLKIEEELKWIAGSETVIEDILSKNISSIFHKELTQLVIDKIELTIKKIK